MTIWVNTPFDTLPGEGGRPMRYWLLCRALAAAGHDVVLWSSDFHHVTKRRRALDRVYAADGFHVRLIPTPPYRANVGWRRVFSHWRYARRWAGLAREAVATGGVHRPDCILVSLPPLGLYATAARMSRRWGCRVVVDIQDAWPETFYRLLPAVPEKIAALVFWPARRQAGHAYRGADGVSAVSSRYLELTRAAGRTGVTGVFPLGCPLAPGAVADDRQERPADGRLNLVYAGNLGEGYDIRTMIDGLRNLVADGCRVALTVAGDGPRRDLVQRAVHEGLPVDYRGYLNAKDLEACLAACDAGVVPMFPSSWVAVPNKVADYAAAGLAMVNGLAGETQELLDRHAAGLVYEAGNVASFMAAVRRYADDRLLLDRHRQGARQLAEQVFDQSRIYPAMVRWLEGLAAGVPPTRGEPQRSDRRTS